MERDLEQMPYDERAAKLAQVKRETMGREYSEPEAPPSEDEEGDRMPDQYDWGLWFGDENYQLPHSYVYRRDVSLQAGTTYHFQTRNLRPLRPPTLTR